jgi:outer membrane immunogenic protein
MERVMHRSAPSIVGVFVASLALIGSAAAADFPRKAPSYAPIAPVFTWTGFYVGVHGGWGWSNWDAGPGAITGGTADGDGWIAGFQAGYNYQMGNIVVGVEGDFSFADVKITAPLFAGSITLKNDYYGTVTGRLGYAFDRFLVYGKGGVAFTRDKWDGDDGLGGTATGKFNRVGWTIGGGVEYALWNNFSVKAEYNFMDYGEKTEALTTGGGLIIVGGPASVSETVHIVKVGANYRF